MKNYKKITIGNQEFLVIDLTRPLSLDVKVYPGDPKPQRQIYKTIKDDGYEYHIYKLGDHNFQPHGDAPKHQNKNLGHLGFDAFGIDYCFNQALMIDVSRFGQKINGIIYAREIKKNHLYPFAKELKTRGALIIRTGYDRWLEKNLPHSLPMLPHLNPEAAKYIFTFKNIKVVGTDSLTVDQAGQNYSHQIFKNKMIVESMVNLHSIPLKNRRDFFLQTSPVRIVGATGGPVTAYAFIRR